MPGATLILDAEARIGDGPHGSAGTGTGDYDHYALPAQAGQLITVYVNAAWLGSTLDTALAIYNSSGTLVASNDDRFDNEAYGSYPDSFIRFLVPASDIYSVAVFGSGSGLQADPFDSASGGGVGSEGFYRLDIVLDSPVLVSPAEDDGAIPLANDTGLRAGTVGTAFAQATIGDGPHGSATGDFDFYRVEAAAGQTIAVDTDTPVPLVGVDTAVGIYDSAGNLLAFNDDDFETFDSLVVFEVPETGTYFVIVSVFPGMLPADPFDPSFGPGVGSEGDYSITIDLANPSTSDFYSFDLPNQPFRLPAPACSAAFSCQDRSLRFFAPENRDPHKPRLCHGVLGSAANILGANSAMPLSIQRCDERLSSGCFKTCCCTRQSADESGKAEFSRIQLRPMAVLKKTPSRMLAQPSPRGMGWGEGLMRNQS